MAILVIVNTFGIDKIVAGLPLGNVCFNHNTFIFIAFDKCSCRIQYPDECYITIFIQVFIPIFIKDKIPVIISRSGIAGSFIF